MGKIRITAFIFIVFILPCCAVNAKTNFLVVSDIHFNPFSACQPNNSQCVIACSLIKQPISKWDKILEDKSKRQYPHYRSTTNYYLLQSTINQIKKIIKQKHPKFILILGDFIAHHLNSTYSNYANSCNITPTYKAFSSKLMAYISYKFKNLSPHIYPAIGNNDSGTGNYSVNPGGYFLKHVAQAWLPLIKPDNNIYFLHHFAQGGGYYAKKINSHFTLLSLNTVMFSTHASTISNKEMLKVDALRQLFWLQEQFKLARSHNSQVLLIYHIPPGIDIFQSLQENIISQWKPLYQSYFLYLLRHYKPIIIGQLAGHLHTDGFYIQHVKGSPPVGFVITTPAISPIYSNNPSFKLYSLKKQHNKIFISNLNTYYLNLHHKNPLWKKEYDFSQIYGSKYLPLNEKNIKRLLNSKNFSSGISRKAKYYKRFFTAFGNNSSINNNWHTYWCGMNYIEKTAFSLCRKK